MENKMYQVAIIGMGPSGITASIYLKRSGIDILCLDKDGVGGELNKIDEIENYPSYIGSGKGLVELFEKQLEHFDIQVNKQQVLSINQEYDGTFLIRTLGENFKAKSCIICSGIKQRPFNVPNSNSYNNLGISRCAECDAPFSKNKPVAVLASTSSGAKEALYLASLCSKVYFINPEEKISGDQKIIDELNFTSNIEVFNSTSIVSTSGTKKIETISLSNNQSYDINALFLFIGASPITEFLGYMDVTNKFGQIITDEKMQTKVPGLFACGDARINYLKQVVTACSDGAIAAVSCRNYLKNGSK